ncbi:unnamed protein product [Darwinula stevensoni]|uniref:Centromere protein X n=1 Tax=Darwinula stevensoni TaxID=69355 RepID=A0A7R8X615_9CRUS|nr:unnamed protein product [Darwinula stevensoni]CAG0887625.1 unnamed protein product [Darwinula stevensoni]
MEEEKKNFGVKWNFKAQTVEEMLKMGYKETKTRMTADALQLVTEFLKVFVCEGAMRAAHQAKTQNASQVEGEHLEKVLPQLLLDF